MIAAPRTDGGGVTNYIARKTVCKFRMAPLPAQDLPFVRCVENGRSPPAAGGSPACLSQGFEDGVDEPDGGLR